MLKIFCLITGDDFNIVKMETPASKKKIRILATVLMIPALTWFVIGHSLSNSVLEPTPIVSICVGLTTSVLIFIIERTIIMSDANRWIVAARLLLGLLIALLGSIFIDEMIFKKDIDQQSYIDLKNSLKNELLKVSESYYEQIQRAKSEADNFHRLWTESLIDAKQESDGSGGSGVIGIHAITKLKLEISKQHEVNYDQAKKNLTILEEKLSEELDKTEKEYLDRVTGNSLLFRIKSLFNLVSSDKLVLIVYLLITTLLFVLEFIVIITKYAMPESNYEKRIKAIEVIGHEKLARILDIQKNLYDPTDSLPSVINAEKKLKSSNTYLSLF